MTTANHPNRAPLTEDELLGEGTADDIAALEAKYGGPETFEPTGDSQATAPAPAPVAAAPAPASAPAPAAPAPGPAPAPAAAATPAPAPAPASSAAPAADVDDGQVSGVATADGKRILPYGVLQEARRTASINRQRAESLDAENQELKQQLEALKSGHTPDANGQFTDEQLAEIKADHPQLAPLLDTVKQLQETVAKAAPAPAPKPAANPDEVANHELTIAEQVDAAIADRPLLARYRELGGVGWKRAAEIDDVLYADPKWKGRPLSERFAEVEKQLAQELGVPVPSAGAAPAPPAPAPAPSAPAPAPAAPAAAPAPIQASPPPNTLSDMAGGTAPTDEISGLQQATGQDLVNKFAGMTDAQIEALLYRAA